MKIRVILEKDEAGCSAAQAPAMPGCLSQGRTKREAIAGRLQVMASKAKPANGEPVEISL